MDRVLIREKLESLRRCVQRFEAKCPEEARTLQDDPDLQDIVTLNLTRAVQLAVDLGAHLIAGSGERPPGTMGETFDRLQSMGVLEASLATSLKRAVGFRNIAVHNYEAIDWDLVHRLCRQRGADFRAFARAVSTYSETAPKGADDPPTP